MKSRLQLRADQLFATGLLESQVDNSWFLPIEPFDEAHHVLALSIDISETLMNCNLQNIEVNGKSIDVFPAVEFRLTSHNGDLIPLDRDLLRNPESNYLWLLNRFPKELNLDFKVVQCKRSYGMLNVSIKAQYSLVDFVPQHH